MHMLLIGLSTVCATLPMMAFLALVWWLDRYDREPIHMVVGTFTWGATGAIGLAMIGSAILTVAGVPGAAWLAELTTSDAGSWMRLFTAVFVAPAAEEPAKALILLPIVFSRHFDNMTDGFVYGAAAGLGFGMTENLLYFLSVSSDVQQWIGTVFIRTFYSAVMHATATAVVGAGLGWGRFRGMASVVFGGGLGAAGGIGIHATWNGLLTIDQLSPGSGAYQFDLTLLPLAVFSAFVVFEVCVLDETRTIRIELEEEAATGLVPPEHPQIIASWLRRMSNHWVPPGLDKRTYIAAATSLAMRKRQRRLLGDDAPGWYSEDIDLLRRKIQRMLTPISAPPARAPRRPTM